MKKVIKNDPQLLSLPHNRLFLTPLKKDLHTAVKEETNLRDLGECVCNTIKLEEFYDLYNTRNPLSPLIVVDCNDECSNYLKKKFTEKFTKNGKIFDLNKNLELTDETLLKLKSSGVKDIYISIDSSHIGASYIDPFNMTDIAEFSPHDLSQMIYTLLNNFTLQGADYKNLSHSLKEHLFNLGNIQSAITIHSSIINCFEPVTYYGR